MKKEQLKSLIKLVIKEVISQPQPRGGTGTHDFSFEIDGKLLPGLFKDTDMVEIFAELEYNTTGGSRGSWMDQPEGDSIEITDQGLKGIRVRPEAGGEYRIEVRQLNPQKLQAIEAIIRKYAYEHNDELVDSILSDQNGGMKEASYLGKNAQNKYVQRKKTLLSVAKRLTENMKRTARDEFGV